MADAGAMPKQLRKGLKSYGKGKKTKDIEGDLQGKAEDPAALAVFIRKYGLGEQEFKQHQKAARKKK